MSFLSVIFGTQFVTTVRGFQYHYWTSEVTVDPESPTTADKVNVTVSFSFTTMPPLVEEFGNLTQVGNVFSVNVSIYDQRLALPIVYEARYTYHLGRLPAGSYQFKVYVNYTFEDFLLHWYWLEKTISFTVTPSPRAEFTCSPPYPGINATMTFDASDSKPGWNGTHIMPIVSFAWDFGDGNITITVDPTITHKYRLNGTYTVILNITDSQGLWNVTSKTITIYLQTLTRFELIPTNDAHVQYNKSRTYDWIEVQSLSTEMKKSFLKFDLRGIVNISSAVLRLLPSSHSPPEIYNSSDQDTVAAEVEDVTWSEETLNWFNQPTHGNITAVLPYDQIPSFHSKTLDLTSWAQRHENRFMSLCLKKRREFTDYRCGEVYGDKRYPDGPKLIVLGVGIRYGPTADFTYSPSYPPTNETVTFDASTSLSGKNGTQVMPIVSYAWDFGDGTNTTQIDPIVEHTYTTAGDYAITLNVTDGQGLWNITSQIITVNLAEFSLVTLYKVHLDLDYWFGTGANLTVAFYTYDGEYQGNTTVWTGITPKRVVFSTNITHSQGKPIEIVNLVLTDNFGNILQTIITFVVHRSDLFGRTAQIAMRWPFALLAERITLFKELTAICRQWPYAPT